MKITFVTPLAAFGGGIRAVAMYAGELQKLGHDVTVVSTGPKWIPFKQRMGHLLRGKGWWRPLRTASHLDSVPNIRRHTLERYEPITAVHVPDGDVVIATWWETAEWVSRLPASKGVKVYFVQHHEVVFDNQPVQRVAASYRLPLAKICCAPWLQQLMANVYGDPTAAYVPYGVDHDTFNAPPRGKQPRPTVGLMYASVAFKGIDVAIHACELARQEIPDLRVQTFGEQKPTGTFNLPLPDWFEFEYQPKQSRIAEMYRTCDAWLFPSRCEGFGLPILEAMACRTPVLGTPTGIMPHLAPEGGGMLTKMGDPASMAAAIVRVAKMQEAEWRGLSDAAFATASRFRWDVAARAYEAHLRELLPAAPGTESPGVPAFG